MRKVFMVAIAICICLFTYFGGKMLLEYCNEVSIVMKDAYTNDATSGGFAFKKTPEDLELLNSYLLVNNNFIDELSKDVEEEKSIKNLDDLIDFFPSFKMYYSAKLKIKNIVYTELPYLINNAISLSDNELKNFFENRVDYIATNFGVTSFEDFKNIVDNLSYLQKKEIKYAEIIENSLSYNPYGKCSMFRLKVQSNNENDFTVFSVNAYVGKSTEYQQAPVIVLSAMGGMS